MLLTSQRLAGEAAVAGIVSHFCVLGGKTIFFQFCFLEVEMIWTPEIPGILIRKIPCIPGK